MKRSKHRFMRLLVAVGFLLAMPAMPPSAAADEVAALREEMRQMRLQMQEQMKKMEELQARLDRTEQANKTQAANLAALEKVAVESQPAGVAAGGYQYGEGLAVPGTGVTLAGYIDAHYEDSQASPSTFDIHEIGLFVNAPIGENFKVFSELEFEHGTAYLSNGTSEEGEIKMARGWLEWTLADWAKVKFGKNYTPMSLWNLTHAYPLIPSHRYPLMVSNSRVPRAFTGIQLDGILLPKAGEFDYYLGVGNGKGPLPFSTDNNQNKMIFGKIIYLPPLQGKNVGDLHIGIYGLLGRDGSTSDAEESLGGSEFIYKLDPFTLWAEGYRSWVDPTTEHDFHADGFFVMGIYEFLKKYSAYVRYEENDQKSTAINANANNGRRWVYGLSYRPIPPVVCRIEFMDHRDEGEDINNDSFLLSISSMF